MDGKFWSCPNASEMHQEKATERPATEAAEMAGLAEDIITILKSEISGRREEQLKQRPAGKQLDAAKTTLSQAATLMTKRNQEAAAAKARARSTRIQNAEEEDAKTALGVAAVIDGMVGAILPLTKTHQRTLTADEGAGLQ